MRCLGELPWLWLGALSLADLCYLGVRLGCYKEAIHCLRRCKGLPIACLPVPSPVQIAEAVAAILWPCLRALVDDLGIGLKSQYMLFLSV
jgi:hypothetical protein